MSKFKAIFYCTIAIAFAAVAGYHSSNAQPAGGGYAESYLLRDVGSRPVSMAGAYTAVANDPNSLFYNPAGLGAVSPEATFSSMYSFLEFGRSHSTLAWAQNLKNAGLEELGVGLGINYFSAGSFVATNKLGVESIMMTNRQFAIAGGAAYNIEFASFGVGVKYLSNTLSGSGTSANGFGIDLGSKFNIMDMFTIGVAVQNIAGIVHWNTPAHETDFLPYSVRAGIGMEFGLNEQEVSSRSTVTGEMEETTQAATNYILFSLDAIAVQHENAPTVVLGTEIVPHEVIAFRGGIAIAGDEMNQYKLLPMTVWGAGVSVRPRKVDLNLPFKTHIDYSVSRDNLAINKIAHHLSIVIELEP